MFPATSARMCVHRYIASSAIRSIGLSAAFVLAIATCSPPSRTDAASTNTPGPNAVGIAATDDAGIEVVLPTPARRVVSLIPSVTETIIAIGGGGQLVGRTRYDTDERVLRLPSVGGTSDPSMEAIAALEPDLVIVWQQAERAHIREQLLRMNVPSFAIRAVDTADVLRTIRTMGRLLGRDRESDTLLRALRASLADVAASTRASKRPSVFFLLWGDPPLTASPSTFIGQLISLAGGRPLFDDTRDSWPTVSVEEIVRRDPDIIVVPVGEMRPTTIARLRELPGWRDLRAVRTGRLFTVPADLSNRPGPHIAVAAGILRDSIRALALKLDSARHSPPTESRAGGRK